MDRGTSNFILGERENMYPLGGQQSNVQTQNQDVLLVW